ncbi:MAG: 6-phosphogluconolactonase [Armatimonadota bacterium]
MSDWFFEPAQFLSFRDQAVCERVRRIPRAELCNHPNPNFKIRIIDDEANFFFQFAAHVVAGIKRARDEGRQHVVILPAPWPHYRWVAHLINIMGIDCSHVHTFNMDEWADQDGNSAPADWPHGFQYWMREDFFSKIDPKLRMPESQIHFPGKENVNDYSRMIEDLGGADICYGGIGWCGHIAFFESHLGVEFGDDIDAYLQAGARLVELHPITIMQSTVYSDNGGSGDWSYVPPKAYTVGPRDLKNSKLVSFWNCGYVSGGYAWQRFITRLAAHGPVTPLVPSSILQILPSELSVLGAVADDYQWDVPLRTDPLPTEGGHAWGTGDREQVTG